MMDVPEDSVTVRGAALRLLERGQGEPVVLVHGSASDVRTWEQQVARISRQFRVLAYSRRHHFPNARIESGGEYDLHEHVSDLIALLEQVDAPAHLVGHSYGGLICLVTAMRRPELVRTLVLTEPPVMNLFVHVPPKPSEILASALRRPLTTWGIVRLGAFGLGPAAEAAKRGDEETMIRRSGEAILGKQPFSDLSHERRRQIRDNLIPEELLSTNFLPPLSRQQVSKVDVPVLLVEAQNSPVVFRRLLSELHTLLPHAERVSVPRASHLAHEDNPEAFNDEVIPFLCKTHAANHRAS